MSARTSANRYARALFDVALKESDIVQVEHDLTAMAELMRDHGALLKAANRHGIPDAVRRSVTETIAEKLGVVAPVRKLLLLLAEGHRLNLVPELTEAYRERLLRHQNIVSAEVTSAVPLSPDATAAIEAGLARVSGKKVRMSVTVDPALIGGVVARIDSTVYDGSVRTQLSRMKQQLLEK